jgi:hypothetical protein
MKSEHGNPSPSIRDFGRKNRISVEAVSIAQLEGVAGQRLTPQASPPQLSI